VVIVSIPQKNVPDLAAGVVAKAKPGAPVIETNNYYPRERDGRIESIESGLPESAWVAEQLGSPVYKVFNGIFWKHLLEQDEPAGVDGRIALPVAGADGPAKDLVLRLVDELGFDPVDAGPIEESWRQQPGTPVYGKDYDVEKTRATLAEAVPECLAAFRAA
jgi:8-hydroxy-5-deazaflavin:NADPH oxidoreductase